MFYWITKFLHESFASIGFHGTFLNFWVGLLITAGLLLIGAIIFFIIKWILCFIAKQSNKRRPTLWKNALLGQKFYLTVSALVPILMLKSITPHFFASHTSQHGQEGFISSLFNILVVVIITSIVSAFMRALTDVLLQKEATKDKPIKSYTQIITIVFWIIAIILIISIIIGKSPVGLLAGIGAFSAVLLLVFQDTITGFIYSIQLASNDLVRNGDWITMNKFNADGTVEEINLVSVKVRNFDNTISTIPVKQLIADSFQNWRGMEDMQMRRIKRSFNVDVTSIKPCTPEMLAKFKQVELLKQYIEKAENEISSYNTTLEVDTSLLPNGRHLTNIGVLRVYFSEYLKHHPSIDRKGTTMIRQLAPSEYGLPIEIYCFTNTTAWIKYENIQSDIFDHLYSVLEFFEIRAYQRDSGKKA